MLIFFKDYLILIICLLVSIAYYTLAERKIMASFQRRKGPNVIGIWGLLQPLADGIKLALKYKIIPNKADLFLFLLSPILILNLSLFSWIYIYLIPLYNKIFNDKFFEFFFNLNPNSLLDLKQHFNFMIKNCNAEMNFFIFKNIQIFFNQLNISITMLVLLAISSLNVYCIILSGWASNSKYAFFGSLRSGAQMISYEVSIGLTILPVFLLAGNTLNINNLILNYLLINQQSSFFLLLPCSFIFFISMLAETNRTPFDLTEAEAELVAGYNVEYSSITFAMFFLAEYSNMLLMSIIFSILFLGSSNLYILIFYYILVCFLFVLVRATFPRYKYNELMNLGWKVFLPITLSFFIFLSCILVFCYAQMLNFY